MIIDTTFFSYGSGLVIAGWICGMCVSYIIKILERA